MFPRIDEQGLLQLLSKRHVNNDNKENNGYMPNTSMVRHKNRATG